MCRLKRIKPCLYVWLSVLVAWSSILKLRIKSSLHLGLLKEHLLPNFIDSLLVFNGHGVGDSADFFASLAHFTLNLLSVHLAFRESRVQLRIHLAHLTISDGWFFQFPC